MDFENITEEEFYKILDEEIKKIIKPSYFSNGKLLNENSFYNFSNNNYRNINISYANYYDPIKREFQRLYMRVENNKLSNFDCTCSNCRRTGSCAHIAGFYHKYKKELFKKPLSKLEIGKKILNSFETSESKQIKEELTLKADISFHENYIIKFSIGTNKTYMLNTDYKLAEFKNSYETKKMYFGKNFTYDPNIHYFNDLDKKIIEFVLSSNSISFSEREFLAVLDLIKDKSFTINGTIIKNIIKGLPPTLLLEKENDIYCLSLKKDNYDLLCPYSAKFLVYKNDLYILDNNQINLLEQFDKYNTNKVYFKENEINIFKAGLLKKLNNKVIIDESVNDFIIDDNPDIKLYFDLYKNKILCDFKIVYDNKEINYFDDIQTIVRNEDVENRCIQELNKYNFSKNKNKFELNELDDIGYFLEYGLNELNNSYNIFTSKKIDSMKVNKKISIDSTFSIGKDGILSYSFEANDIDLNELNGIFENIRKKKKYYKLKNGNLLNLDDENLTNTNDLLNDLNISNLTDNIEIPKYKAFYIDSLKKKYRNIKTSNSFDVFIENFKKYKNIDIKLDDKILRDYQKDGIKWLYTIYKCDLGGILADEMGLGKSIQTIYLIKEIIKENKDAKIMIVCPTSLVYNWKKEFDKFGSELKYVTVAENKEKRKKIINDFENYNVFITSYGLIRNDNDEYENKNFELCIIDEAQAIKNYQAELTKEVKKIKARTKIALTGTPIENSIFELWSIFDFIMPGYLNTINKFKEEYGISDFNEKSMERLEKLNYQIKPFILRRKKKDVIKDLPDKIEDNIYLELPDKQKKLYLKVLKESEKEIDEIIENEGFNKASFKILQLLTKLRQICIDPNVAYQNYNGEVIKIEKLIELINELKTDHKILIFSSFKTVLDNLKNDFNKNKISYYSIDGSVKGKERMELVEKFNKDKTNCFLITLKSGGTGLNLTSADIVIHLDIWWNPQAENQATDRTHRIGQTKTVNVIKLITKGTIEEKIIELQNKKKLLSDNVIEGKNTNTISSLTEKEVKELLSFSNE